MRIFNEDMTKELQESEIDDRLGHFKNDKIVKHIDYIAPVEEQGHYETIQEYPNGGKDVQWVVDVPGVKEVLEHDEVEEILIYIPPTIVDINNEKIDDLKNQLSLTDYKAIKYAEGYYTEAEYASVKKQRQNIRNQINKLRDEIQKYEEDNNGKLA